MSFLGGGWSIDAQAHGGVWNCLKGREQVARVLRAGLGAEPAPKADGALSRGVVAWVLDGVSAESLSLRVLLRSLALNFPRLRLWPLEACGAGFTSATSLRPTPRTERL